MSVEERDGLRGYRLCFHRCFEFTKSIGMSVSVVLAEEQLASRREDCTYPSSGSATIAPIRSGQRGASQCSWHDSSVLAWALARRLGLVPHLYVAVALLCQTYSTSALFPMSFHCVVNNTHTPVSRPVRRVTLAEQNSHIGSYLYAR